MDMEPKRPVRVVLIDDHRHMHEIVAAILHTVGDIVLVGQGANGQEAIQLCEDLHPDLALMDVMMPVMDGIQATRILRERFPETKVLVLSSFQDHESVYAMLRSGAAGYITKSALAQDLVDTIRTTMQGKAVFSAEILARLIPENQPQTSYRFHLTDRELEVLTLMAEGLTLQQIAQKLVISPSTVKFHITNIVGKLGVQTRSEALIVAAKNNLV